MQAIWITAFLDKKLRHLQPNHLKLDLVRNDTALLSEYERLRRPKIAEGVDERYGEFVFDCMPYLDILSQDLGLRIHRKKTTYKEWFEPYGLADYKDLVER